MANRKARYVILCEDLLQAVFIRTYLRARGIPKRQVIRERIAPAGKGSAEHFVRTEFVKEVNTFRAKNYQDNISLIVMIDADLATVQQRLVQLEGNLEPQRQPNERIAIFVPKRHVETWIRYAAGDAVDESASYHDFARNESSCKPHVKRLATEICMVQLPEDAPDSLHSACNDIERVL